MNYLLMYLKFIDQIIINHDKRRDPLRYIFLKSFCPKSSTPIMNAPLMGIFLNLNLFIICPSFTLLLLLKHISPTRQLKYKVIGTGYASKFGTWWLTMG